jgi:hypothetical protein
LVQVFLKKWWVESDFKAPNLPLSLRSKAPKQLITRLNDHRSDAIENLTFHPADSLDRRVTMILSAN